MVKHSVASLVGLEKIEVAAIRGWATILGERAHGEECGAFLIGCVG